jgi:hypothetical protein
MCNSPPRIPYSQSFSPQSDVNSVQVGQGFLDSNVTSKTNTWPNRETVPFRIGEIYPIYEDKIFLNINRGKQALIHGFHRFTTEEALCHVSDSKVRYEIDFQHAVVSRIRQHCRQDVGSLATILRFCSHLRNILQTPSKPFLFVAQDDTSSSHSASLLLTSCLVLTVLENSAARCPCQPFYFTRVCSDRRLSLEIPPSQVLDLFFLFPHPCIHPIIKGLSFPPPCTLLPPNPSPSSPMLTHARLLRLRSLPRCWSWARGVSAEQAWDSAGSPSARCHPTLRRYARAHNA